MPEDTPENISTHVDQKGAHADPILSGRAAFAFELLKPRPDDRTLNIGCFDGGFERTYLKGLVREFYGIDVNAAAIAKARQWSERALGKSDVFQISPAEKTPFPDRFFDKIICLDTFEHVNDEAETANEIYRILKPGGQVILSVPHDFLNFLDHDELTRLPRNLVRKYIKKKPPLDHPKHRHYSEADLRRFFYKFDFDYVHKSGTPIFWILGFLYTAIGLPDRVVAPLSKLTASLENWDYRTRLKTGFNIMVVMSKRQN